MRPLLGKRRVLLATHGPLRRWLDATPQGGRPRQRISSSVRISAAAASGRYAAPPYAGPRLPVGLIRRRAQMSHTLRRRQACRLRLVHQVKPATAFPNHSTVDPPNRAYNQEAIHHKWGGLSSPTWTFPTTSEIIAGELPPSLACPGRTRYEQGIHSRG